MQGWSGYLFSYTSGEIKLRALFLLEMQSENTHTTLVEPNGDNAVGWLVRPLSGRRAERTMFRRKTPLVRIGESFIKAGDPAGTAWRVTRVWTTAIGIPHAQIENNCAHKETRIISVSALTDTHFFGPLLEQGRLN